MREEQITSVEDVPQGYPALKRVRDIVLLAAGYFVAGQIGGSLAVPPGYATIIWPASGVALCALLTRGAGLWPGVWLGSFAFNIFTGFESATVSDQSWRVIVIAAAIATGACVQALAGLWMARRFTENLELTNLARNATAAFLIVVLPCVIAPTIGVTTLLTLGAIDAGQVPANWLTWYSGDFFGVLLIMPILLLSSRSPVAVRWHGRSLQGASSLVAISLITTLLLTFYAWRFISEREDEQAEANFAVMATNTQEALHHRLQIYQRALESGAAFVSVNGGADPSEWREYVERMDIARSYPGMRGFGMFEAVDADDLPAFRARFAREFGDRFEVHPEVPGDQHFVINRIEPLDTNLAALGLDLAFEKGRREAIARSLVSLSPVMTRPIVLVQDARQGAGFLMVLPVTDAAGQPTGRWVYSPLVADELLSALSPQQGEDFMFEAYHGERADPEALLYAAGKAGAKSRFSLQQTIELAGQPVTLSWRSLPAFETRIASSAPMVVLISGLVITILLGVLLTIFLRRESHVIREVNEATAELEERNRMLEQAEQTAHIGHWHLNLADNHLHWSDEVHRLHGLEPGDTPALQDAIDFYHADDRRLVEQSVQRAIADCKPYTLNARLLSRCGTVRHVEVRGRVNVGEKGEAAALLGVIIDRTDETIMRQRLTETIEEARAADAAKSSFLANMSHEIRTPMNGVIGFTELALSEETDPEQSRRLQMILDSGNAMLRLLNDLLDFAKIEAKQMAIVAEPTDLRHTLRTCQRLMEPVAREKNIGLNLNVDTALPPRVMLDKMRLRQIVLNLVGNALKFTEVGEVTINASVSGGQGKDARLHIAVRDTGIGIAADRLDTIFGKFTQADDTTARRYGGTGLGLSISTELAELMDGRLHAESTPGEGSVFTLSLPLQESEQAIPAPAQPQPKRDCGHGLRLNILIAEDNPVNQELTLAMVKRAGHDCHLVPNGQEAVDEVLKASAQGRQYDLVLMDIQMPVMDGLQATREIRARGIAPDALPILAVTANAYADDIQLCQDAGMQAHLGKPLRFAELCHAIGEFSSRLETEVSAPQPGFEVTTSPRLESMFEERKASAVDAIDTALRGKIISEGQLQAIASLLHQIAGVAAFFGQEELGEYCRANQHEITAMESNADLRDRLETIRGRLKNTDQEIAVYG